MVAELIGSESAVGRVLPVGEGVKVLTAREWATRQFGQVDLGDQRLNRRVVEMATRMADRPSSSLPKQMESHSTLMAAYRMLGNEKVTIEALLAPSCRRTLEAARLGRVVLFVEDTTELDYTAHPSKKGLGPIGDGKGRGLLLHSTMAVLPEGRKLLGLAHAQVAVRQPTPKKAPRWKRSPEAQVWEASARAVGSPPAGARWVHVSDRASDIFEYLAACVDLGKDFVVRAFHNRLLSWPEDASEAGMEEARALLDYARTLSPSPEPRAVYTVHVQATKKQLSRDARVVMAWSKVSLPPPPRGPEELRAHAPIPVQIVRVWEESPPEGAERVEWVLLTCLPVASVDDALPIVDYYTCRWLCEDYHQCLKTGCGGEESQLDDGSDITRLLGLLAPIAAHLLELRQFVRQSLDVSAQEVVDPLLVELLARRQNNDPGGMTISEFWRGVARMGGHQGRRSDGPPGWRTIWKGWLQLSDMASGVRLMSQRDTTCLQRCV